MRITNYGVLVIREALGDLLLLLHMYILFSMVTYVRHLVMSTDFGGSGAAAGELWKPACSTSSVVSQSPFEPRTSSYCRLTLLKEGEAVELNKRSLMIHSIEKHNEVLF